MESMVETNNNSHHGGNNLAQHSRKSSLSFDKRASIQSSGQCSLSSGSSNGSAGEDGEARLLSSNADYDRIRNTTLMFFLDRLVIASKDGKEARTLHDLSCLFGTKDFTKEMRQIAGASQNGLKKFLESYPSLFTIEGDKVYLTQLQQNADSNSVRDYNKEAVEYFTHKLQQFGTSLVPIRNLFGYRSQASQEVRHISGKNTKEFKQFLTAYSDVFEILADDHVVLKSTLQELESRGESFTSLQPNIQPTSGEEAVSMDPYLNKQFAHMIEECMAKMMVASDSSDESASKNNEEQETRDERESRSGDSEQRCKTNKQFTIEFLHEKIMQDCNNQVFLKMVRTIDDLKVFLRMHPKIFKRGKSDDDQKEYVSLLTEEERKEMENTQSYMMSRQHSTLKRSETAGSNLSEEGSPSMNANNLRHHVQATNSLPPTNASTNSTQRSSAIISQATPSKTAKFSTPNEASCDKKIPLESSKSYSNTSLRATAPPFVPLAVRRTSTGETTGAASTRMFQRSVSNLNPSLRENHQHTSLDFSHHHQQAKQHHPRIVDQNQSIRNYLIKASSGNTSGSVYAPNKMSNGGQHHLPIQHQQVTATAPPRTAPLTRQFSNITGDDLRTRTVNIVREASNIVTKIMTGTDAVALDCKGYNLGFNGFITLIQFGFIPRSQTSASNSSTTSSLKQQLAMENRENVPSESSKPEVCVFDLITNPELAYCLKPLLESDQIVKIVHDVRNKSNALYSQFGIILNNVFDTQVANLVIQQQETGKPAYKSRFISMSKLCEVYGNETLLKYRKIVKTKHCGSTQASSTSSSKTKDVNYWRARPLTETMVYEATMDVYCLAGGIYRNLKSQIKPEYEPLFEQLNVEGVLARIKPDEIRSVRKERKIDLEVIDLKRKLYSDTTSSIVLSNREIRLLRHVDLTEEVRQKIQQCKKVARKLERLDMKAAQNAQMLQSMNSQISNDADQSLGNLEESLQTNGSSSSESNKASDAEQAPSIRDYEGDMDDLMDSSMFDELKDKMIESSSLLESLEDDDDDIDCVERLKQAEQKQTQGSGSNSAANELNHDHSDGCRCNCHQQSSIDDNGSEKMQSLKSSHSSDKDDASSSGSRVVDMAVQCDLLS